MKGNTTIIATVTLCSALLLRYAPKFPRKRYIALARVRRSDH